MQNYVLVASDKSICGIYSNKDKLISAVATTFSNVSIDKVEIWETDKGFVDYLKISKKTTITIED